MVENKYLVTHKQARSLELTDQYILFLEEDRRATWSEKINRGEIIGKLKTFNLQYFLFGVCLKSYVSTNGYDQISLLLRCQCHLFYVPQL